MNVYLVSDTITEHFVHREVKGMSDRSSSLGPVCLVWTHVELVSKPALHTQAGRQTVSTNSP